jgi:uncharacterized repeat protein (TIGR04076 family)
LSNPTIQHLKENIMATGIGHKIVATITNIKGQCSAGHKEGEQFEISCHDSGGLCGFCYHHIFSNLQTLQFGGKMPWWQGDKIIQQCPDPYNLLTLTLERQ